MSKSEATVARIATTGVIKIKSNIVDTEESATYEWFEQVDER